VDEENELQATYLAGDCESAINDIILGSIKQFSVTQKLREAISRFQFTAIAFDNIITQILNLLIFVILQSKQKINFECRFFSICDMQKKAHVSCIFGISSIRIQVKLP